MHPKLKLSQHCAMNTRVVMLFWGCRSIPYPRWRTLWRCCWTTSGQQLVDCWKHLMFQCQVLWTTADLLDGGDVTIAALLRNNLELTRWLTRCGRTCSRGSPWTREASGQTDQSVHKEAHRISSHNIKTILERVDTLAESITCCGKLFHRSMTRSEKKKRLKSNEQWFFRTLAEWPLVLLLTTESEIPAEWNQCV